ncbi:DNA-binding protein WhiA [Mycoplasma sp. 1018B]|uniref:DNA-binding protein WhiA n=1 Tax=Mycoplasma sp. 1018B TaxID=2967302 RepID=UPI00211D07DA|nr:DNA-binding protein WhiA [Mycoplasma sp. 1018B]UUM19087.1 DNA-binding protein WhiA [Mycoplasma sp. 1018B]
MNFSLQIKYEILKKQKTKDQIYDFLKGFISSKVIFDIHKNILLVIRDKTIRENIINFLNILKITFTQEKTNIIILAKEFNLNEQIIYLNSFFAGFFAGSGSINNLNKTSYHLAINSNYEIFIDQIQKKLNTYDFGFVKMFYKQKYILYIKKQEKISDFLKAIEAINSYFIFEDSIITRDYQNNINRLNNIDYSNIEKIVNAQEKYLEFINYINEHNLKENFKEDELVFFDLIKNNIGESLNNYTFLLQKYNIHKTKAGLNHWLIKLKKIVNEHKEKN